MPDGARLFLSAFVETIAPRPVLSVSAWADAHRMLAGKAASEPGQWRTERVPYMREPMDAMSAHVDCEEVVIWTGTQMAKSESANNVLGYYIDHEPCPVLFVQPTLDTAKRYSKQRVQSMIEATPALSGRVREARSRDSGNTVLQKDFDGGVLVIAGANSAAGLRSMPARVVLFDEIDAYPFALDEEGDPISLAEKRQDTFGSSKKRLKTSTCTVKGASRIEQAYEKSDRRRYHVPCPDCGHYQVLRWGQIQWKAGDPGSATYVCEACGVHIAERAKPHMLEAGRWVAEAPESRIRGYWISSLYSPLGWLSWADIVREFLEATGAADKGDHTLLQTWTNTRLAETWEEKGSQIKHDVLQARAEPYALRTVPLGGLVLTMAVDVQSNRLEYKVKAWGRFEESWTVDYGVLWGDPAAQGDASVWTELLRIIATPLKHAAGTEVRVLACAIDSGGHHTHEVYQFCRRHRGLNVFAVKGLSVAGRPILGKPTVVDINQRGERLKKGAQLWLLGVDTAKGLIYGRLKVEAPGPGYMHFSHELPGDYYDQLTAERLVTRYVKGRPRHEWVKPSGRRNEALDLEVYAIAAAHKLQLNRYKAADWDALEQRVQPVQADLLAPPADAPAPAPPLPAQVQRRPMPVKRRGGFVKGY
jgi:phage terminase large subunit GpA-like protein